MLRKQNIEVPSVQNLAFLAMTNQGGRGRIILETTECIYSRTLPNDHLVQKGSSLLRAVLARTSCIFVNSRGERVLRCIGIQYSRINI